MKSIKTINTITSPRRSVMPEKPLFAIQPTQGFAPAYALNWDHGRHRSCKQ